MKTGRKEYEEGVARGAGMGGGGDHFVAVDDKNEKQLGRNL